MYKKILVAIDDSETSRCALAEAVHLARNSGARLYVAHVADETLMRMHGRTFSTTLNLDHAIAAIADAGRKLLDDAVHSLTGVEVEAVFLESRQSRVSEVLIAKAEALGCDLIVAGRHGQRGLARLLMGSVAEQLAKMANTSVLLVRNH